MFSVKDSELAKRLLGRGVGSAEKGSKLLAKLVAKEALEAEPITYEDFLPASAAGIFQSNLPQQAQAHAQQASSSDGKVEVDAKEAKKRLVAAVGGTILDYFELYAEQQRQSLVEVGKDIGIDIGGLIADVERDGA